MHESEQPEQPTEGEKLRESVDEADGPVVDGRSSADDVARDIKEKEERAEEAPDG